MKGVSRTIKRRRKEGKTDYKARRRLLISGKPRVVVRKTNRYIVSQIVISRYAQDKVEVNLSSKELMNYGWPKEKEGSLKNLTAAYLSGILMAKKSNKISEGILDAGLIRSTPKSRVYSFVKGLIDGGFSIKCDEKMLPTNEDLEKNEEMAKLIKQVKEKI
jgi:large subunit ribosomal protein L18